jgi:hypothetical protein
MTTRDTMQSFSAVADHTWCSRLSGQEDAETRAPRVIHMYIYTWYIYIYIHTYVHINVTYARASETIECVADIDSRNGHWHKCSLQMGQKNLVLPCGWSSKWSTAPPNMSV